MAVHPWLRLAWQHPEHLTAHVSAYAGLAADEAALALGRALARGRRQFVIGACLGVAAVLAGTALMLWAAFPALTAGRILVLIAVPLAPLLAAGRVWRHGTVADPSADFAGLRAQLALDRQAWAAARADRRDSSHPGYRP